MSLKVGIQMDHVSSIHIAGDSTFALGLEAQARGHTLFHWEPNRLQLRDGVDEKSHGMGSIVVDQNAAWLRSFPRCPVVKKV